MSITVYTLAWGGYWERFGKQWTSFINQLTTKPDEIIVVSDRKIETNFKLVIEKDIHVSSFRNAAIKSSTCEWVVPSDIDDEPYPNYLDNLDNKFDIIAFTLLDNKNRIYSGSEQDWSNLFLENSSNPIVGTSAVKRELLLKTMYKRVGWEDWNLWVDLKKLNASVKFDPTVRFKYNRISNSLSRQHRAIKNEEFKKIKIEKK